MIQLEHKRRIVEACYPEDKKEAIKLWHDIKPIKFGAQVGWSDVAGDNELAAYQIPEKSSYLLILRVETYQTTFDPTGVGFGQYSPPPTADTYWAFTESSLTTPERVTPTLPIHLLCDVDEILTVKGDHRITLLANLPAAPDLTERVIRTTVYGYLCGSLVSGKIGDSDSTYWGGVAGGV